MKPFTLISTQTESEFIDGTNCFSWERNGDELYFKKNIILW